MQMYYLRLCENISDTRNGLREKSAKTLYIQKKYRTLVRCTFVQEPVISFF